MTGGGRSRGSLFRTQAARRRLIGLAIVLAAALAGYGIAMVIYPAPLVSRDQRVALVIGMPVDAATRDLEASGFKVKILPAGESDPTLPAGYVTWQEPPAWVALPEGSPVELTVSGGPAPVTAPDVLQFDLSQARRVLAAAGLSLGRVDSVPSNAEEGVVIATRPPAGTALRPGSPVEVVVSRGPAAIRVPALVGMAVGEGRTRLEELGLRVGVVREVRRPQARPGSILEQRPRPGTLSARGGRVDLVVVEGRTP